MMVLGQMARAAIPFAIFFIVIPGLLLLGEHPGTAGFVITVITMVLGVILLAIAALALRFSRRSQD